jgi:hypothetical protein
MSTDASDGSSTAEQTDLLQVARELFDKAATRWWAGWSVEFVVAVIGVGFGLTQQSDTHKLILATVGGTALAGTYALRVSAESTYVMAETIRRQSAYFEGIGWAIPGWQVGRWLSRAGTSTSARDPDYYSTRTDVGPQRIGEMTLESAFYSRMLFKDIARLMFVIFVVAACSLAFMIWFASSRFASPETATVVATSALSVLPALLALDALGRSLRLHAVANGIADVERDLEQALLAPAAEPVLRLVSEYNCLVVLGIPIPARLFSMRRETISNAWRQRVARQ